MIIALAEDFGSIISKIDDALMLHGKWRDGRISSAP